jgi:hypothetical protein
VPPFSPVRRGKYGRLRAGTRATAVQRYAGAGFDRLALLNAGPDPDVSLTPAASA